MQGNKALNPLAVALAVLIGPAVAAQMEDRTVHQEAAGAEAPVDGFAGIDRDADGYLSFEEWRNVMAMAWPLYDRNGDDKLDGEEIPVGVDEGGRPPTDRDGDGTIDRSEFFARGALDFALRDVDEDGKLSRGEATAEDGGDDS